MNPDNTAEIGKIRRFGRYAQAGCVVAFVMLIVMGPMTMVFDELDSAGIANGVGRYFTVGPPAPVSLIVWSFLDVALLFALVCVAMAYLLALFRALGRGSIYTPENVRRIRRIGQITFGLGVVQIVFPLLTVVLIKLAVIPKPAAWAVDVDFGPDSLLLLVTGGLVLLVSWIMEVGRRVSEDAEQMRRDAELVV